MERNDFSVGIDLLLGLFNRHFSAETIDKLTDYLDSLPLEQFKQQRRRLLALLESGATEQEMLEAAKQ